MKRVIGFGEVLLRLSPPGQERLFQSPALRTWFGGSEANVAAGLAHLGERAEMVTRLPANPVGDAALAALRAEGIGVDAVLRGGERQGIYFVESGADIRPMRVVYDRVGSAFARLDAAELDWTALLAGADWFQVSGITPALGDGPAEASLAAVMAARAAGIRTSLDLNLRPALWIGRDPVPTILPIARHCDVVMGNPAAVEGLLGIPVRAGVADSAEGLRGLSRRVAEATGAGTVALTHRVVLSAGEHEWGAALYDAASDSVEVSRRWRVRLVDRVGGGDSFAAALIHTLLHGRPAAEALEFAVAASALKLTIAGDFNRVTADEVERVLRDAK